VESQSPRIHTLPLGPACAYLIESEAGLVLVDAGMPGHAQRILNRLRWLGRDDLRLIFITHAHFDHYGSAAAVRRATGAPIGIHRADRAAMARGETPLGSTRGYARLTRLLLPLTERWLRPEPTEADVVFEDGEDLDSYGIRGRVVHTPGHTLGSSCLILEDGTAFVGDLVASIGRPRVQHLYAQDWDLLRKSLARLADLAVNWACPGHGCRPLSGAVLRRLASREL